MSEKTHWKKAFNSPYLGSWDLPDYEDITLTIKEVRLEKSKGLKENSTFNVVYFKEDGYKPMLLNATNSKTLRFISDSPYIDDWKDLKITIGVEPVKAFGELHDALRIRKIKHSEKKVLNEKSDKWKIAIKKVAEGMTFKEINKRYIVSIEDFNKLKELAKNGGK